MKVEVTDSGSWRKTLDIEVPSDDVKQRLAEAYKSYSKSLNLPGFRKGKVPVSVVKTRFGPAILQEVLTKTEEEFYREASQAEGITPVSQATIEDQSYEDGEPLRFKASVDVKPDIEVENYKKLKVVRPVYKIGDEQVDERLQMLREQNATETSVERPAALGDVLVADFAELGDDGLPVAGREQEDRVFLIGGPNANHDLDNQLVGLSGGDEREVDYTHDHEDGESHEHTTKFRVVAKEIRERELSELDDEFAKDLGDFESLDALKQRIQDDIQGQADSATRNRLVENIVEELIAQNEFDVPDSMVDNYIENMIESIKRERQGQEIDEEAFRSEGRSGAERGVKRYLLLEAIAQQESVEVTEEDLDKHLEEMSERHNVEGSRIRQILGRSGQLERIKSELLDNKVFDFLIENAKVEDVEESIGE